MRAQQCRSYRPIRISGLELTSLSSGPSFDLVVSFPLLLGTIPLQEAMSGLSSSYDTQFGGGFTLPPPPDQFK